MQTIKPGMSREALLSQYGQENGKGEEISHCADFMVAPCSL
jgi:hypothetical protein